jgi:hypothetical protein
VFSVLVFIYPYFHCFIYLSAVIFGSLNLIFFTQIISTIHFIFYPGHTSFYLCRSAIITWCKENVWVEVRNISKSGSTIVRKSVRFTRSEVRLVLDQSRRLLLEVAIEQQKQTGIQQPPSVIPTLKRCATEVHGFEPPGDEGYASNDEGESVKKQRPETQEL